LVLLHNGNDTGWTLTYYPDGTEDGRWDVHEVQNGAGEVVHRDKYFYDARRKGVELFGKSLGLKP
jgi:hypothetical protein